jgi:hypothetical protein
MIDNVKGLYSGLLMISPNIQREQAANHNQHSTQRELFRHGAMLAQQQLEQKCENPTGYDFP